MGSDILRTRKSLRILVGPVRSGTLSCKLLTQGVVCKYFVSPIKHVESLSSNQELPHAVAVVGHQLQQGETVRSARRLRINGRVNVVIQKSSTRCLVNESFFARSILSKALLYFILFRTSSHPT